MDSHFLSAPSAAVLVLLTEESGRWEVLVTRRSRKLRTYPGEICCPGGKRDPTDQTPAECALREAMEEVGIPAVEAFSELAPIRSSTGLAVFPVLAKISSKPVLKVNPAEVERAFWIPLEAFLEASRHEEFPYEFQGTVFQIHEIRWRNTLIHGITCAMLIETARQVLKRDPEFPFQYRSIAFN